MNHELGHRNQTQTIPVSRRGHVLSGAAGAGARRRRVRLGRRRQPLSRRLRRRADDQRRPRQSPGRGGDRRAGEEAVARFDAVCQRPQSELAERLAEITPGQTARRVSSPAAAPRPTKRPSPRPRMPPGAFEIVALRHSYSGRAAQTLGRLRPGALETLARQVPGIRPRARAVLLSLPVQPRVSRLRSGVRRRHRRVDPHQHHRRDRRLSWPRRSSAPAGSSCRRRATSSAPSAIARKYGGLFICRRSANRLGPHRRQVVRHRTLERRARHDRQRQGHGQRRPGGRDDRHARGGRQVSGHHLCHLRRQPGVDGRGAGHDPSDRGGGSEDQRPRSSAATCARSSTSSRKSIRWSATCAAWG